MINKQKVDPDLARGCVFIGKIIDFNEVEAAQEDSSCHFIIASSNDCSINFQDGSDKQLSEGSVCYVGPNSPFKLSAKEDEIDGVAIIYVSGYISDIITKSCTLLSFHITNRPTAMECFNQLYRKIDDVNITLEKSNRAAANYYQLLIEIVYSTSRIIESKPSALAQKIKSYIEDNINTDISIASVAKHFYLSETHIIRIFKNRFGETPKRYIIKCKVNAAKLLLLDTTLQVKEIAMTYYFSDSYHFSHTFKRLTGYSPEKYRTRGKEMATAKKKR